MTGGGGHTSGSGGSGAPPPCQVPHFSPLHVRGGRRRLRRLMRHRRRAMAAGLAMTAAALAAAGPPEPGQPRQRDSAGAVAAEERGGEGGDGVRQRPRRAGRLVTAPVRIADAATVRLLRPGDRVDVVAADGAPVGGAAAGGAATATRVVAAGARVSEVPESPDSVVEGGALVVLSVPRATAARLAGASATARLAVTLR
ncbi:RcpC/CpaB family pilus assembly protein [Streptomyces aurantiacus]|nr:RcpC/CpaB family pilus assembly protein [Streptomyces aurantiacus]